MADKKLSKEELEEQNKLENEAYFELCQIIAEAMQTEDLEWLNTMVSYWKTKYKKVLDNASPSFKKKLDYLLNQFYSEAIRYILSQLKTKEEKAIKNQNKAINELYNILKDNYDLKTLNDKIKKWKEKYPYKSFLKMYQRRIDSITSQRNLEENAFNQEQAFRDLYYDVVNRNGTIEELKSYLANWEEKYKINKKFTIEQFINHQSEVKRYVSDEYLISIAKKDDNIINEAAKPIIENSILKSNEDPTQYSPLDVQASAYSKLLAISTSPNNVNDVFNWVYKNRAIKFNDKYKELILSATALNYSPKFLNKLKTPDINILSSSLSLEEYDNISKIKEYAIISYFNLFLPPEVAASNNYFNDYAQKIYENSKNLKHKNFEETIEEDLKPKNGKEESSKISEEIVISNPLKIEPLEIALSVSKNKSSNKEQNIANESPILEDVSFVIEDKTETPISEQDFIVAEEKIELETPALEQNSMFVEEKAEPETPILEKDSFAVEENIKEPLSYDEIVAVSPLFFEAIHNLEIQSQLISMIDTSANTYVNLSSNEPVPLEETKQRQD